MSANIRACLHVCGGCLRADVLSHLNQGSDQMMN